jgi:predicted Fe-Mo cluster-binding NifX family protein
LYHILDDEPELLYGAKLADKAVGRTAAKAMVDGGVEEVWADVISNQAYDVLQDAGIRVNFDRKVDHATFLRIWEKMGEEIA